MVLSGQVKRSSAHVKLIECPRDAMQGRHAFIPTAVKTAYIQQLLACGFDTLDFGSFVSPKAIPQMRDTAQVVAGLDLSETQTKLLAIVANRRGAVAALKPRSTTWATPFPSPRPSSCATLTPPWPIA